VPRVPNADSSRSSNAAGSPVGGGLKCSKRGPSGRNARRRYEMPGSDRAVAGIELAGAPSVDVTLAMLKKVSDRGRHRRALSAVRARWRSTLAARATSGAENSRRNNASEASACVNSSPRSACVQAQKAHQIRRRGIRSIQLGHRGGDE